MSTSQSGYSEINLTFEEEKFRAIYEPYYENLRQTKNVKRRINIRGILLFTLLSAPFFIASIFYPDWIYVALILIVLALYQSVRLLLNKKFYADMEAMSKADVEHFISLTRDKKSIKYQYNDEQLEYVVDGEILGEPLAWNNASSYYCDNDLIMVYFENPASEIMLPKSMTRNKEFKSFVQLVAAKGIPEKNAKAG